ncbi:uncharacterized protein A4U43_C03F7080 [Asparagus officinalis]|uniref:Protein kinase domain-containing protein n=1 Tax=Asparagus officinalis TaxID=4686 RepID=A0A5P1FAR8_ASPOF|nr:probable LRR receptor-like serine/threonine-protein kinase At2g16250 [Asparagus officinalis]ONK74507.1 uncharacterized protein A4U43_C03F7080 [Asparagus officinalis]
MNPNPANRGKKMLPFLLLLLLFTLASTQPLTSTTELTALYSLRSTLGLRSRDWPRKTDPCSAWRGVTCRSGHVIGLNLSGLRRTRLGRTNPRFDVDGLKKLSRLEFFNSTGFALPGPVPVWFGSELSRSFAVLVLRSARINGSIPYSLGLLGNLSVLDLSGNLISGFIPTSVGILTKLETLILSNNELIGSVPAQLEDLHGLKDLNLSRNELSGLVPDFIWSLGLQIIDVSSNNFTGVLPDSVQTGSNPNVSTAVFNLSSNLYFGSVSVGFQMFLQRFGVVDLSSNYFQGTVALDDKSRNQSVGLNCFRNEPNQRNPIDCKGFYKERGIAYDGPSTPPPSSSSNGKKKSQLWKYILAGVLGFLGLSIILLLFIAVYLMRAGARTADQRGIGIGPVSSEITPPPPSRALSENKSNNREVFSYDKLILATSEFSDTNLIKKGHSGDLYSGVLESGFSIVVKRIDLATVKHDGYVAEVDLLAKASHTRLVPFLGQCSEKENERFLVYKYMPHRDLASSLYKEIKSEEEELASLDWITRLKIAVGVAEALCFLHHECNPPLVHRDVQASSILLDDKFEVSLGSLSEVCAQEGDGYQNVFTRFLRRSQKPDHRTSDQGTSGSPAPTCAYDIYCFGKVLLELVTGKLGLSGSNDSTTIDWLNHTLQCISLYDKETLTKIIDPSLVLDEDLTQEVFATAYIAKTCLDPKPSRRPLARYVLKALENPLKLMRLYSCSNSNSVRLRSTSSWASWNGAFFGSWRQSSSDVTLRRSCTVRSQESLGECSFSRKRHSTEIFPEPLGNAFGDEDLRERN